MTVVSQDAGQQGPGFALGIRTARQAPRSGRSRRRYEGRGGVPETGEGALFLGLYDAETATPGCTSTATGRHGRRGRTREAENGEPPDRASPRGDGYRDHWQGEIGDVGCMTGSSYRKN